MPETKEIKEVSAQQPKESKVFDPVDSTVLEYKNEGFASAERKESALEDMWGRLPNSRWKNVGRMIQIDVFPVDDTVTTGDGKRVFFVPPELDGTVLIRAIAFVTTVSSSGALTIQIRNSTQSLDMLSTAITIDQSENSSLTAATPPVIKSSVIVRSGDLIFADVDGAGTGAKGLGVQLSFI